ncbi:MAG: thermonuclease family protein [Acidobacteriota bacterium]
MFRGLAFLIAVIGIPANAVLGQTVVSTQTDKQKTKVVVPTSLVEEDIKLLEGKAVIVYEGDVISIQGRDHKIYSIRLQGIDAPDEKQNNFKKSKNRLADLILGKEVKVLVHKKTDLDRYVGSVYLDGRDVGLTQIEDGMAWHYKALSYEQTTEDRKRYAIAEQKARTDRKGLWEEKDPVAPWDFRGDVKLVENVATKTPAVVNTATGRTYVMGPRGGCYFVNESGAKVYVRDKTLCSKPE